jgi:hypothetical protein
VEAGYSIRVQTARVQAVDARARGLCSRLVDTGRDEWMHVHCRRSLMDARALQTLSDGCTRIADGRSLMDARFVPPAMHASCAPHARLQ